MRRPRICIPCAVVSLVAGVTGSLAGALASLAGDTVAERRLLWLVVAVAVTVLIGVFAPVRCTRPKGGGA